MSNFIYDAEASVELRDPDAAAATTTVTGTAVDFDWVGGFAVALNVSAVDRTTGDETYVLTIQSLDSAGGNAVTQYTLPAVVATGEYAVYIDGETASKFDADAAQIRAVMTLGGTTPSITYGAWIHPIFGLGRP